MIIYFTVNDLAHLFHCKDFTLRAHLQKVIANNPFLKPHSLRPKRWTYEQVQILKLHFKHNPLHTGSGAQPQLTKRDLVFYKLF